MDKRARLSVGLLYVVAINTVLLCNAVDNDVPLLLTPFLDKGDIQTAQNLSEVRLNRFPELRSHAGYITVDRQLKNHMFFWHFPSQQSPQAPLMMWLNGGPGVSSMMGLVWSHGPLEADREKHGESYGLRNHTWVGPFSVVYVDNPVGTGYSFSETGDKGYKLTQDGYTHDLYSFVLQFFQLFPEYKSRQFYLSGQSYAGKYVPALAHRIHQQRHNESAEIPLTGIILGAPFFDPPTQTVAFFDYLYALGAISHADKNRYKTRVQNLYQTFLHRPNDMNYYDLFLALFAIKEVPLPNLDNYVSRQNKYYYLVEIIMNSTEIRDAIHVGPKRPFQLVNRILQNNLDPDLFVSTKSQMGVIMDNYKVLIYNGDYDVVVSSAMVEAALLSTNWSLQGQYNASHRITWNTCAKLKGFYSRTGNFCRVVVHGAGHRAPHDVPDTSLEMVTSFLKHGCITDQTVPDYNCPEPVIRPVTCSLGSSLLRQTSIISQNLQLVMISIFLMLLLF